jgi:hypothetical protein
MRDVEQPGGGVIIPPGLPREVRHGLAWVGIVGALASSLGIIEFPWQSARKTRDEWAIAHASATALIQSQGREILVLQDRDKRTQDDLSKISNKLEEMAMVLYSLERRTR